MKNKLELIINEFINNYSKIKAVESKWKEVIVTYADAEDEMFYELKKVVSPSHALPKDFLPEAKTVVTYFIPLDEHIIKSNIEGKESSRAWAKAYVETNELIKDLNIYICSEIEKLGYKAKVIPTTLNYDNEKQICDWSQRHVAFIAGLGKFGLNNMLITDKGCCGRIGSFITDLTIEPTKRLDRENCLYKHNNTCKKCVDRCVNNALKADSFDRYKCHEMCMCNDKLYSDIGLCDVCGKCLVNVPCSMMNPVRIK